MNRTGSVRLACAVGAVAFAVATAANAATYTWTGANSNNWNDPLNWTTTDGVNPLPGYVPAIGEDIVDFNVPGTFTVDVPVGTTSFGFLQFENLFQQGTQAHGQPNVTFNIPSGSTLQSQTLAPSNSLSSDYVHTTLTIDGGGTYFEGRTAINRFDSYFTLNVVNDSSFISGSAGTDRVIMMPRNSTANAGPEGIYVSTGGYFEAGWLRNDTASGTVPMTDVDWTLSVDGADSTARFVTRISAGNTSFMGKGTIIASDGGLVESGSTFNVTGTQVKVTLDGGTVAANDNQIAFSGGATLEGSGTVTEYSQDTAGTGGLRMNAGSILSPGLTGSPIGLITIIPGAGGDAQFRTDGAALLNFDVQGLLAGEFDQVVLQSSNIIMSGAAAAELTATVGGGYVPVAGDYVDLITYQSGGSIALLPNLTLVGTGLTGALSDTGTSLRLTFVPEPASLSLLALGGLALRRRRA